MINQIAITHTDDRELTKSEIDDVLQALRKHKKVLPPTEYEYRSPSVLFGTRQTLYLIPKSDATFPYVQVQNVLDQEFPGEYTAETI